jgi:hypothetical protein
MRIFNRVVMILLLAGLFLLGVYMVAYSFNLFGYRFSDLPFSSFGRGISNFVQDVENGSLSALATLILILLALLGLFLLIAELMPATPRRVRMQKGTYIARSAVKDEVEKAAEETPNVLGTKVNVKAKRRPGAQIDLDANVRRGEDAGAIKSDLQRRIQERLGRSGVPVSRLKIRMIESDPRETKTRVQ